MSPESPVNILAVNVEAVNTQINELNKNLKDLGSSLSTLSTVIKNTFTPIKPAVDSISVLARQLGVVGENAQISIRHMREVSQKLLELRDAFKANFEGINEAFSTVFHSFEVFEDKTEGIKGSLETVADWFSKGISPLIEKFKDNTDILVKITELKAKMIDNIRKNALVFSGEFEDIVRNINSKFEELAEGVKPLDKSAAAEIQRISKNLIDQVKSTVGEIRNQYVNMTEPVENALGRLLASLGKISEKVPGMTEILNKLKEAIKNIGSLPPESVKKIQGLVEELKKLIETTKESTTALEGHTVSTATLEQIYGKLKEYQDKFNKELTHVPGLFSNSAKSIAQMYERTTKMLIHFAKFREYLSTASKAVKDFVTNLASLIGISTKALTGITILVTALSFLWRLFIDGHRKMITVTQSFREFSFAIKDLPKLFHQISYAVLFSRKLLPYSFEDIMKTIGEVMSAGAQPIQEVAAQIYNVGKSSREYLTNIAEVSMLIRRFASALGTDVASLTKSLTDMMSYMGITTNRLYKEGYKFAKEILTMFARLTNEFTRGLGLSFSEVMDISKEAFERVRWLKDGALVLIGGLEKLKDAIVGVAETLSLTPQTIKAMFSEITKAMTSTTWDLYLGILAYTGKWEGSMQKMMKRAFEANVWERFTTAIEFFRSIAGAAGLEEMWPFIVPMFRGLAPELIGPVKTVLDELLRRGVTITPGIIREELKKTSLSVEQIEEVQMTIDALGDPLIIIKNTLQKIYVLLSSLVTMLRTGLAGKLLGL